MQQFPIFTNFFMYTALATFQVAQIEFTIGLDYASILSREREVSGFFDEASPVPHVIGLVVYICIIVINSADLACSELYNSGIDAAFWPMRMTALSLDAALWLFSIGGLISTACQHYAAPQKRVSPGRFTRNIPTSLTFTPLALEDLDGYELSDSLSSRWPHYSGWLSWRHHRPGELGVLVYLYLLLSAHF